MADDALGEGVVATQLPGGMYPLVAGDEARVKSLRAIAESISKQTGKPIKLLEFSLRTDVEVIGQ